MKKKIIYLMLGLLAVLLLIPYLVVSQDTTIGGIPFESGFTQNLPVLRSPYESGFTQNLPVLRPSLLVSPQPESFCDTIQIIALFVTDTITGESKTRRVCQERKGTIDGYWREGDYNEKLGYIPAVAIYEFRKNVQSSRYWYFFDGSQVFIDPGRVLETYGVK